MQVPFLDLKAQYQSLREELLAAAEEVLASSAYVAGPFVKKFEEEFAQAQRIPFCAGMSTGTDALHAAIALLGIGHGDEVIVPANTFMATPAAVSLAGARPVFVDCEEKFFNIDVGQIEAAITPKTKAIIPVHLFGQPARVEAVCEIAKKHGLHVIEDCAQSHLARRNGKYTGSFGIMGCFSFYPGKNLGACGEGGAVITSDAELHKKLHAFREHGMYKKYHHDFLGHNYRMEGIQGAFLSVKLPHLPKWTETRRANANLYRKYLANVEQIRLPEEDEGVYHAYHLFVIRADGRNELADFLRENGVATGIHYPIPCHLQKAYSFLNYSRGDFPVSEILAGEILSLPMSEQLTEEQVIYVAELIRGYYTK